MEKLYIDGIAATETRDVQGELLKLDGADISELLAGRGRFNDNHQTSFYNQIGHITEAKKIFKEEDCENDRQKYFWEKQKAPYLYVKGYLFSDTEHPNAKAAAAILRNIHKNDTPLKLKSSVEGGTLARSVSDPTILARTKIHSVALTFTPANHATLIEPLDIKKSDTTSQEDFALINSVMHLAKTDVPSFRQIERYAEANKIRDNINRIQSFLNNMGINTQLSKPTTNQILQKSLKDKIKENIVKINQLAKALMAGFGGAGAPGNLTGGGVLQTESIDVPKQKANKEFKFVTCFYCGKDQVYFPNQTRCRGCGKSFDLSTIYKNN
jgi:hypothetical protein